MTHIADTYIDGLTCVDIYDGIEARRPFHYTYGAGWVEVCDVWGKPLCDAFLRGDAMTAEKGEEAGQFLLDMCELLFKESI